MIQNGSGKSNFTYEKYSIMCFVNNNVIYITMQI